MLSTRIRHISQAALIATLCVGSLVACSNDIENAADTAPTTTAADATAPADDLEAFCAVATELVGVTPTSEQLAAYAEAAPVGIAEAVDAFVAAFEAAEGDLDAVFADPDASAAADEIAVFESDECGITQPGPPPGAPGNGG